MSSGLLLLASGTDRPGIVDRISGAIFDAGCNLEDSRMAILGGDFSLMVLFTGTGEALRAADASLRALGDEMQLLVQTKETSPEVASNVPAGLPLHLRVVAMDHPGIVHRITRLLHERGVNVARLDTTISHAPVSATPIFSLELEGRAPADVPLGRLRAELNELGERENVDVELSAGGD